MIRKGLRPGFKFGIDRPGDEGDFRRVLPFRKSWVAISILAVMDIVFLIPAVLTFQQAIAEWGQFNSLFLYTIFVKPQSGMVASDDLADIAQLFVTLWPALAALFISHAFSFYKNFLGRNEYRGRTVNQQMSEPYSRIIFMHLVLIFGGGLTMVLGNPAPILLIVIGLKIYFDVKAHLKQHAGNQSELSQ